MQITNEEMETLNRASEILSKYADQGDLSQEDFDHFERMVIAIIDGIEDKEDPNYQEIRSRLEESNAGQPFPTTKWKIDNSMLQRDVALEKQYGIDKIRLYGYFSDTTSMKIVGEIISNSIKKPFCMICTLYDKDGDIIETTESNSYGSGLVTSMINPKAFFSGFPFKFSFWSVPRRKMKKISITPADSY